MILCRDCCTIRVKMDCKHFVFLVVNNCRLSHQSFVVSSSHLPNRHGLNGCQQSSYCLNGCLIISIVSCPLLLSVATDNSSTVVSSTVVLSQRSSRRLVSTVISSSASSRHLLLSVASLLLRVVGRSPPVVVIVIIVFPFVTSCCSHCQSPRIIVFPFVASCCCRGFLLLASLFVVVFTFVMPPVVIALQSWLTVLHQQQDKCH